MTGPVRRSRRLWLVAALAAFLVAGVASGFASTSPDGLEHVAETIGFVDQEQEHPAAASPLSDYQVRGVEDARLSTGMAGVAGVVVVLALAGGLAFVLSRRRRPGAAAPPSPGSPRALWAHASEEAAAGTDAPSGPGSAAPRHGS